jgi:hypothetical protein
MALAVNGNHVSYAMHLKSLANPSMNVSPFELAQISPFELPPDTQHIGA